jgi:SAM-dependent methyltransferase
MANHTIPNQKRIVRSGYDKLSYAYRSDETPDDHGAYAEWVAIVTNLLPRGAPVLDIGCGCGLPATKLLAKWFNVTGIDFSEVQIRRARQLVRSARFVCQDVAKVAFPAGEFSAIVSFYTIIQMPLEEHPELFRKIAFWLRPAGYLLAIVGHDAWSGTEEKYLGVQGGRMCWSHADEATNLQWIRESGFRVHWKRFVPEGDSGHTLVFAQKPPVNNVLKMALSGQR